MCECVIVFVRVCVSCSEMSRRLLVFVICLHLCAVAFAFGWNPVQRSGTCCPEHHATVYAAFHGQFGCMRCRCYASDTQLQRFNELLQHVEYDDRDRRKRASESEEEEEKTNTRLI